MIKKTILGLLLIVMLSGMVYSESLANIQYSLLSQTPDPSEPGSFVELRFMVENVGDGIAKDVVFMLEPEYPFNFFPGENGERTLGNLYMRQTGNEAFILYYKLKIDKDATEGNFPVRLKYSINGGSFISLAPFDVRIQSSDAILYIDSIEQEPKIFSPGSTGDLHIKLKNMAGALLKNIKVTVATTKTTGTTTVDLPISPVDSSNEKVISQMSASLTNDVIYKMIIDPSAASGIYKVPVTLDYIDNLGNSYTKDQVISIRIGNEPDIFVKLDDNTIKSAGDTGYLTIKVVNRGTEDIKFVTLKLGDSEAIKKISSDEIYVGNIDSDDYESADFNIQINDDGSIKVPVTITYMDSLNREYKLEKTLDFTIYSAEEQKELGITTQNNIVGIVIVVIVIIIGLIIFFRLRKKNNNKDKELK